MWLALMWVMTAAVVGFALGRVSMYGQAPEGSEEMDWEGMPAAAGSRGAGHRTRGHRVSDEGNVWSVGSPVSGQVTAQRDGEHPTVVIYPDCDKLYAPAGGKITRLFPMGNAFLFATEFGAELYIQAGDAGDELLVRHFRPRVIQNEVVGKGKLLLEFDRQGLEADGASAEVSVCVERAPYGGEIRMGAEERVKAGEEILTVREPSGQGVVCQV